MKRTITVAFGALCLLALATVVSAQEAPSAEFQLTSNNFKDGGTLPISAIYNYTSNGSNACSINGAVGLDKSPQLSWTGAPPETRSFAVTVFDTVAGVVHWGMYNISPEITSLPQNTGVAGSSYGLQVQNVFSDVSYDGPCPPAGVAPDNHRYLFTVWALDTELTLFSTANFPASALTLYRALVGAGSTRHILATASIVGFYSTTPPAQ
jgi:Raf kinase inhibitor-like YbhB/YbcL family protein